jgi:outer membrane protein assembly factor BamB
VVFCPPTNKIKKEERKVKNEGRRKKNIFIFLFSFFPLLFSFAQSGGPSTNTSANTEVNAAWLWRQAVGGAITGLPTVQAQSIVAVLDGGTVKAYSASGRPLWSFYSRGRLSPYVTRSREGTSYICRTNGIFIALSRIGKELWRTNVGGALSGPVVLGWDGRVFVPAARKIFCYTASGNLLWTRELEAAVSAGPWLDQDGGILLALENSDILRIDQYGAVMVRRLSSAPRLLISAGPSILALYRGGDVQLINPSLPNAAPVNAPRLPSPPLAAACRGGSAAVALANGQVTLLSGANGKALWSADTHMRVQQGRGAGAQANEAAVIYDERGIYVLSAGGATGFSVDGKRLWFTTLENASGIPAFDDSGVLYSGGTDWILYAWKLEDRAARQRRTLYGPAPEGFYGTGIYPPAAFSGYYDEAQVKKDLDAIRREILAGRVGGNEREWLIYLMNIAGSGRQGIFSYNRPRAHITHRIFALQLLSRIGSIETIPWLARFFRNEDEPLVKAAAARAIGGIGVDPDGIAIQEFLAAATAATPDDEQVLGSIAAATGALCRFSGPPLFDTGARILVLLSNNHPPSVQRQARSELERLMKQENYSQHHKLKKRSQQITRMFTN